MAEQQRYDRALKALMDDHAAEIIPELIPGSQVIAEQNTEINRTNLRADLVYLITYKGKAHTLNLELQTEMDTDMSYRMLRYHVELYGKYRLPVLSVVMYPFEMTFPEPVFREKSDEEILLEFPYRELLLWTLEAERYVHKGIVSMYTLLPAMKGVNVPMLLQALDAMEQKYGRGPYLARHLWRFQVILRRSKMLSEQDKRLVEEEMESYDSLLDNDPKFQERVAKAAAQVAAQAAAQAKQETMLLVVQTRFPNLAELAKQRAAHLTPDQLDIITQQIVRAPDESMARFVLGDVAA